MQRSKWQFTPLSLQLCFQSRTMAAQGAATNFQMSSARRPPHKKLTLKPFTFYLSNKSNGILNHLDFQIPPIHYQFWSDLIFVIFSPQMYFSAYMVTFSTSHTCHMWRISDFSTFVMWRHLKFLHMWRNFQFPHKCHAWKAKISPHGNFFSTYNTSDISDKYEVCFLSVLFVLCGGFLFLS